MFVSVLVCALFSMSSFAAASLRVVEHKDGGIECNSTLVEDKFAVEKCKGGMQMCVKATTKPDELTTLVAKEMQTKLQEMIFGGGEGLDFLLPDEDTMMKLHHVYEQEVKLSSKVLKRATLAEETEEDDDDGKTFYFGGRARLEFACKLKFAEDKGVEKQFVRCGLKGRRGAKVKPGKEDFENVLA